MYSRRPKSRTLDLLLIVLCFAASSVLLGACENSLGGTGLGYGTGQGPLYARTEVDVDVGYTMTVHGPGAAEPLPGDLGHPAGTSAGVHHVGIVQEDGEPLRLDVSGFPLARAATFDGAPTGTAGQFAFHGSASITFKRSACVAAGADCTSLDSLCPEETSDSAADDPTTLDIVLTLRDAANRPVTELARARRIHGSIEVRIGDVAAANPLIPGTCVPVDLKLVDAEIGEDITPTGRDGSPTGDVDAGGTSTARDAGTATAGDSGATTTTRDAGSASATDAGASSGGSSCDGGSGTHTSGGGSSSPTTGGTLVHGDHGDSCAGTTAETWRCALSDYWSVEISQVCRSGIWQTFHLEPRDCESCGPSYSVACRQEGL